MSSDLPPSQPTGPPVTAQLAERPSAPPPRGKGKRSALRWFVPLLLLVLGGSLFLNLLLFAAAGLGSLNGDSGLQEEHHSLAQWGQDKVAIITISGTIIEGEGYAKRQIDRVVKDEAVKAVVLRVDSPGGTISGSDYLYHHLCKMTEKRQIPVVVSMGGLAASGGYYVAMANGDTPDSIFAEPSTWTGSIGVMIPHYEVSALMEDWGIADDSITSHRLKDMGSFTRKMTEEEETLFQELVDEGLDQFKEVIKSGRPEFRENPDALDRLATGQIFTARQALDNGLIDRIGFIEDAIDRAIEVAGLNRSDVKVVEYTRTPNLADVLLGGQMRSPGPDRQSLIEMTVPRAYYLCSWLPGLTAAGQD